MNAEKGTEGKKGDKPNCYECVFRSAIPGDSHSKCAAPRSASVEGHSVGIEGGWFYWPFNYDPKWLVSCDSFEPKS